MSQHMRGIGRASLLIFITLNCSRVSHGQQKLTLEDLDKKVQKQSAEIVLLKDELKQIKGNQEQIIKLQTDLKKEMSVRDKNYLDWTQWLTKRFKNEDAAFAALGNLIKQYNTENLPRLRQLERHVFTLSRGTMRPPQVGSGTPIPPYPDSQRRPIPPYPDSQRRPIPRL